MHSNSAGKHIQRTAPVRDADAGRRAGLPSATLVHLNVSYEVTDPRVVKIAFVFGYPIANSVIRARASETAHPLEPEQMVGHVAFLVVVSLEVGGDCR
jgi:hypothetical protein